MIIRYALLMVHCEEENKLREKKYDEVKDKPLIKVLKENERDKGTGNEK